MAERLGALEQARGEFVAKVSHDLRTPVTVIRVGSASTARFRCQAVPAAQGATRL